MKYLLDSNAIIALLKFDTGFIRRMTRQDPQDIAVSAIVWHELCYGAYKSRRTEENLAQLGELRFEILDFDADDARCAGELRAQLAIAGMPIGPYDILIAGQAVARSLVLVTRNAREFQRIESLRIEDWQD